MPFPSIPGLAGEFFVAWLLGCPEVFDASAAFRTLLLAAIPGQGAAQLLRQFAHMFRERADHGCGVPARDLEKHHKAGMALDQRRDVRVVCPGKKISFPVTWHGAVLSLGWPFADGDSIDDLSQSALCVAALGLTHLPRRPQMRHQ